MQLMNRASSSPSRLRMAKLTIPENEVSSLAARASSGSIAVLPPIRKVLPALLTQWHSRHRNVRSSSQCPNQLSAAKLSVLPVQPPPPVSLQCSLGNPWLSELLRVSKRRDALVQAYPSRESMNISPVTSSPTLESGLESPRSMRSHSSESLRDRCQRGGTSEEGRVRGGMPRLHSAHALLLEDMPLQPRSKLRCASLSRPLRNLRGRLPPALKHCIKTGEVHRSNLLQPCLSSGQSEGKS